MNVNDRVREVRISLKMNQTEFGSRIDVSQNYLSSIEKGHREVTEKIIKLISFEFNVNENWLRTGDDEMFVRSETFSLDEKAQKNNLTALEVDILKGYMELPPATRKDLMATFGAIYSKYAETTATLEPTPEQIAADEAENYRLEVLAELKTGKSSASDDSNEKETS